MREWLVLGSMLAGALLMLLAAVGILRLPDLFTRMHASTKASSLGVALMLAGVALYFEDLSVTTRAAAIVAFFFLTAPIGAHLLARSAYRAGVPLWEQSVRDELAEHLEEGLPPGER